jgi:isoleucyl-tRNA synthetase
VGKKRFGNWLREAKDWNFSRNRFWGSCIPIWTCGTCGHHHCVGSIDELEKLSRTKIADLHKHHIDPVTFPCTKPGCKGKMKRVPEVFDCWFESGAMPYGQSHYPFENKAAFEAGFPADFIAESLDQTRGWFYTLLVLSTILFDKPAIKNIIVSGLILAEDGKKMSKRLKNYAAPEFIMETYGADALRMYLINSPVVRAEEMKFSENGIREIMKSVIIPFWNAYNFFVEYAITDKWDPIRDFTPKSSNELDCWILSTLQSLVKEVNLQMEGYNLFKVVPALVAFIDDLTNWYIRRSRARFWAGAEGNAEQKKECHSTLYTVLLTFSKVIAPVLPFMADEIYRNLAAGNKNEGRASVHLCGYPVVDESFIDTALETRMALVRAIVGLGNAMRARHAIKNRQPLSEVRVVAGEKEAKSARAYEKLICEELNVKSVKWVEDEETLVTLSVKPNFRVLGKKFGKQMKAAQAEIARLAPKAVRAVEGGKPVTVLGQKVTADDLIIERAPKGGQALESRGGITVGLNTQITEALLQEGYAQEFKNRVNTMRKELGFDKEDRINLFYRTGSKRLTQVLTGPLREFLQRETLALSVEEGIPARLPVKKDWKVYSDDITIAIERIIR